VLSASLSRRQSASLRGAAGDEMEPVVSDEPVVLQPANAPDKSAASATIPSNLMRRDNATRTIMTTLRKPAQAIDR
jgi:hypothetical protein